MSCGGCPKADNQQQNAGDIYSDVKEYYGEVLKNQSDLKTNACTVGRMNLPKHVKEALSLIHVDVMAKYYGCGLVAPECLEGMRILDLGCGAGQDCFVLARLVGQQGHVTGLDMTENMLATARQYIDYHMEAFGHKEANVDFRQGYIEKLQDAGIEDKSYDIVVSNCVINLSPDKESVLREVHRVLKDGGEMYFSDVYSDSDLPEEVRKHKVLWGECIAGALWWEDVERLAKEIGFSPPRLVSASMMTIENPELEKVVGTAKFVSATYRLFKLPEKREAANNVKYNGSITGAPDTLKLDHLTCFKTGEVVASDSEIVSILKSSRLLPHMTFMGEASDLEVKSPVVDPFVLAQVSTSGGCCGPKKPAESTGSSCGTKESSGTGGCCAPKKTSEQVPSKGDCCGSKKPSCC